MATVDLKVGDVVSVPGSMYGTLKYIGPVHGKKGTFAGVQLAPEFAARGKNSGDVEGKSYFRTSTPGSGIFLPAEKAEKRRSFPTATPATPGHGALHAFNQGGRTPSAMGGLPKPNFSQSLGPGSLVPTPNTGLRAPSPSLRMSMRRESLPRPSSPLRKTTGAVGRAVTPTAGRLATPKTRPSLGLNKSTTGAPGGAVGGSLRSPSYATTTGKTYSTGKFGPSLRQSIRGGPVLGRSVRNGSTIGAGGEMPLGPESAFDEEEEPNGQSPEQATETTPTPAAGRSFKGASVESEELRRLREQVTERDAQLSEQSSSIAEMERSLFELQEMIANGGLQAPNASNEDEADLPKDVQTLRTALRDKNERIKALTAEFDANRADFRSTIDTLEMASTETERVYEKRVEELLEELRGYQERNEDVEGFALQFKQLEDVVQELEEGLEDARRGEAEARGEVEFLRGEVERGRSEIRKERERSRASARLDGTEPDGSNVSAEDLDELQVKLEHRDDEIRGLKAIIQNLNDAQAKYSPDVNRTPRPNGNTFGHSHSKTKSTNTVFSLGQDETSEHLQQQIRDIENLLEAGNYNPEELKEEVHKLRQSVQFGASGAKVVVPGLGINNTRKVSDSHKHRSTATSSTASTARPGSMKSNRSSNSAKPYTFGHRRKDTGIPEFHDAAQSPVKEEFEEIEYPPPKPSVDVHDTESVSGKTDVSSNAALWCEICEEAGHDILTCSNMGFDSDKLQATIQSPAHLRPMSTANNMLSLNGKDVVREGLRRSRDSPHPPPNTEVPPPPIQTDMNHTSRDRDRDVDRPAPLSKTSRQNSTHSGTPTPQAASFPTIDLTARSSSLNAPTFQTTTTMTTSTPIQTTSPATNPAPDQSQPTIATILGATSNSNSNSNSASGLTSSFESTSTSTSTHKPNPNPTSKPKLLEGTGAQAGMLGGKDSGVIDPDKWCALCEKDGHDSVDCPLEDAF